MSLYYGSNQKYLIYKKVPQYCKQHLDNQAKVW